MTECGGAPGTFFHDPDYEGYGVKLMGGYCFEPVEGSGTSRLAYRSPGHNSAYYEAETGRYFLIFHTRFANRGEMFRVRVHQMMMNEDGWPVVLPWRYAGEMPEQVPAEQISGNYRVILHQRDINGTEHSSQMISLEADGKVTGDLSGTWTSTDGSRFTCELDGITYHGVISTAFDNDSDQWVVCFTALDGSGAALWGTRNPVD